FLSIIPAGPMESGEAMVFSTEAKPFSGIASLRAGARRRRPRRKKRMNIAAAISAPAIAHPMPMPAATPEEMLFELWPLLGIGPVVELPLGVKDPAELAVGVVGGIAPADGGDVPAVVVFGSILESPLPEGG
ncbi:MAG: hypothetical protein Q9180_007904, partial [Flavoplaca navasiana]